MRGQVNTSAFWLEECVHCHGNRLFTTAVAILGNQTEAEDIVQEVFLRLFEAQPSFESKEHEKAWLIRVTVNLCKSRLRSHWWKRTDTMLDSYPAKTEQEYELMEIIREMPTKYRIVIHLYYYEGYATKEIAELTRQKESTIRQQLTRARRMLKEFIEGE